MFEPDHPAFIVALLLLVARATAGFQRLREGLFRWVRDRTRRRKSR